MSDYSLTIGDKIPASELQANFAKILDQPFGDRTLGYSVLLPKAWSFEPIQAESAELPTSGLKPLGIFFDPNTDETVRFHLQAMRLMREISARDWLIHYCDVRKAELETLKEISPLFADCIAKQEVSDIEFVVRAAARINGDRLFFLQFLAPSISYADLAAKFGVGIASFKLTNPRESEHIERRQANSLPHAFTFSYPASWHLKASIDSPNGTSVRSIHNMDSEGIVQGILQLETLAKGTTASLNDAMTHALSTCRDMGLSVVKELESNHVSIRNSKFKAPAVHVSYICTIAENSSKQELQLVVAEMNDKFLSIMAIGPAREIDYYAWAVNRRCLYIVLESMS